MLGHMTDTFSNFFYTAGACSADPMSVAEQTVADGDSEVTEETEGAVLREPTSPGCSVLGNIEDSEKRNKET